MAQKRQKTAGFWSPKTQRWTGLTGVALGVFLLAALITYDPAAYSEAHERGEVFFPFAGTLIAFVQQPPTIAASPVSSLFHNAGGGLGLLISSVTLKLLGWFSVWIFPGWLLVWGHNRLLLRPMRPLAWRTLASIPLALTVGAVAAGIGFSLSFSGYAGNGIWQAVYAGVGPVGGSLVLAVAAVGFFLLEAEAWDGRRGKLTRLLFEKTRDAVVWTARFAARSVWGFLTWLRQRPWEGDVSIGASHGESGNGHRERGGEAAEADWTPRIVDHEAEEREAARNAPPAPAPAPVRAEAPPAPRPAPAPAPREAPVPVAAAVSAAQPVIRRVPEGVAGVQDVEAAVMEARKQANLDSRRPVAVKPKRGKMVIPPLDILDDVPDVGPPVAAEELKDNSQILVQTLRDFGVMGKVGEVHPGPVITRYEYIPGPGVKVSQILNRQDDLALKLRASRVRILAPIPGKAAVGIEVPNRNPAPIFLRRLLETRAFQTASGPLPLALGKDISGAPMTTELSRMPHLLIAGTTGSGKSVCMNALITSLLMKRTPAELRMLMVDPKMLELPMYDGIPHLLTDVVTDPKVAARTLKWALLEMEGRYKRLSSRGCRNLASYNEKLDREGPREEGEEKLPYIVILIDELADLMMTSGKEVEEPIARLAQLARAVGIHLIVATQRPSVDVITGVIKANFPCRIAFQVASRTDSRTILDQNGAESLLGKGDMLFLPPGQAAPHRVHGAFVSEEETQRLAEAWRAQGEPEACEGLEEAMAEPEVGAGGSLDDPLFEEAARLVVKIGQASASMLQRRLKVGYARAARLVDMLESAGVVAPQDGSKAREILVDEVRLEHVLAGMDE